MSYAGSTDWQGAARALWTLQAEVGKVDDLVPRTWKLESSRVTMGPGPSQCGCVGTPAVGYVGKSWEQTRAMAKEVTRLTTEGRSHIGADTPKVPDTPLPDVREADEVLAQGRGERPTVEALASWTHSPDCPAEAIDAVCERLTALLGHNTSPPLELSDGVVMAGALASQSVASGTNIALRWTPERT